MPSLKWEVCAIPGAEPSTHGAGGLSHPGQRSSRGTIGAGGGGGGGSRRPLSAAAAGGGGGGGKPAHLDLVVDRADAMDAEAELHVRGVCARARVCVCVCVYMCVLENTR